jgi:hypothetical protein
LKAKEACQGQAMIGNPSKGDYKGLVSSNMISNCLIAPVDITNARMIFGPDLASVRGKTVRQTPVPVVADHVAVPCMLVERHKVVTMAPDVFFVNGTAFLVTLSRNVKFAMVEHLPVRTATALLKHIERVLHIYGRGGLSIRMILMDGEFEKIKGLLQNVECNNNCSKRAHEWGRADDLENQGKNKRVIGNPTIQAHPSKNEDRVHILHCALA